MTSVYYENDAGRKLDDGQLILSPATGTTIRIVDPNGKPIAGIEFYVSQRQTPDGTQHLIYPLTAQRTPTLWKKTDADGRAALTAVLPKDKATIVMKIDGALRNLQFEVGDKAANKKEIELVVASVPRAEPRPAPDAKLVDWVARHSIPFKTIDPADDDFGDLAPLKDLIGDRRIVLLGEQSHGDGAVFHAKTRLIRFLHQEMGFDVLAFESGLYDCRRAWQAFCDGDGQTPLTAAQLGIFGIWTGSNEVQPLIEYLGSKARTPRPLELAGFDDQMTALASRRHLVDDVKGLLANLGDKRIDAATQALFIESLESLARSEALAQRLSPFVVACEKIEQACATAGGGQDRQATAEFRFWGQYVKSLRSLARRSELKQDVAASSSMRDRQMAENLAWLATDLYSNRKIIVWAASFHLMTNPQTILHTNGTPVFPKTKTMGHELQSLLGKQECFTVGFTSFTGRAGPWFQTPRPVPQLPAGSLEDILEATGRKQLLLSLRQSGDDARWLSDKWLASPLGYGPLVADWTQVFDALIFIRTMYPSTRFEGKAH
jgi:erythromycin esterase